MWPLKWVLKFKKLVFTQRNNDKWENQNNIQALLLPGLPRRTSDVKPVRMSQWEFLPLLLSLFLSPVPPLPSPLSGSRDVGHITGCKGRDFQDLTKLTIGCLGEEPKVEKSGDQWGLGRNKPGEWNNNKKRYINRLPVSMCRALISTVCLVFSLNSISTTFPVSGALYSVCMYVNGGLHASSWIGTGGHVPAAIVWSVESYQASLADEQLQRLGSQESVCNSGDEAPGGFGWWRPQGFPGLLLALIPLSSCQSCCEPEGSHQQPTSCSNIKVCYTLWQHQAGWRAHIGFRMSSFFLQVLGRAERMTEQAMAISSKFVLINLPFLYLFIYFWPTYLSCSHRRAPYPLICS